MSARQRFVSMVLDQLNKPVLWNRKGPDVFDCSGLVTHCLKAIGGPDLRATHSAQKLADETSDLTTARPEVLEPLAGDLVFYGMGPDQVSHVAILLTGGKCISADGATSKQLDLKKAKADPRCRVRFHERITFRQDLPFHALHRFVHLDAIDKICL